MKSSKRIAICGAGIAGIATAYYLSKSAKDLEIILIDKCQPLTFTSSKSGENFRDYWPHPCMEALSSRSIALMENLQQEYGEDAFKMEFSGYHFVSHQNQPIFANDSSPSFRQRNKVETNPARIHQQYPYLAADIAKSIFIKKAGNVDSITMANLLLKEAKKKGLTFYEGAVVGIQPTKEGIEINCEAEKILVDQIVIATGPFINHLADMVGLHFPIWNTLQRKFIIPDPNGVIPNDMPFTIYADGQFLDWSEEERQFLEANKALSWMTEKFPGAIHIKPESGGRMKLGWAFSTEKVKPKWTIPQAKYFPQVVLKGASRFLPALKTYAENIPTPLIEYGGYYTRTKENWPLIGPTQIDNISVVGALAGFGTMTACAAGELCAKYLTEEQLPTYAPYFHPARYTNPVIQKELAALTGDGQL